ncbi:cupin domain-containing protein [Chitinimonas sp.]|uniref:cupin domain-containing protein n=1 Tax=Chitinimonas sp. TaxID=1934313 RepID=UPI002F945CA4
MMALDFTRHPLPELGRGLPADTDHLLARIGPGAVLLIHVPPGDYPYEVHQQSEYLVCLQGRLVLEGEGGQRAEAAVGQMLEVPPGLRHHFAAESDAVILTVVQKAPG